MGPDGTVHDKLMDRRSYDAKDFSSWLAEALQTYEKEHPATRVPFVRAQVSIRGTGDDATAAVPAVDQAREANQPVLIYVGRDRAHDKDKQQNKERKLSKRFESKVLGSKSAAKVTEGWALLRFDLADTAHATWLKTHGIRQAPRLLLWLPTAKSPEDLGGKFTAYSLTGLLRKHQPQDDAAADKK